jgi:hypothetical protein
MLMLPRLFISTFDLLNQKWERELTRPLRCQLL